MVQKTMHIATWPTHINHRRRFLLIPEKETVKSPLEFTEVEETLIARMYNLIGQRWSLIAGRIPRRTAEEIEKYWTSRHSNSELVVRRAS